MCMFLLNSLLYTWLLRFMATGVHTSDFGAHTDGQHVTGIMHDGHFPA